MDNLRFEPPAKHPQSDFRERAAARVHLRPVHQRPARGLDAEQDVFHHRQMGRERQLLIDHRHAGLAACTGCRNIIRTVENILPSSGGIAPDKIFINVDLPAPFRRRAP